MKQAINSREKRRGKREKKLNKNQGRPYHISISLHFSFLIITGPPPPLQDDITTDNEVELLPEDLQLILRYS